MSAIFAFHMPPLWRLSIFLSNFILDLYPWNAKIWNPYSRKISGEPLSHIPNFWGSKEFTWHNGNTLDISDWNLPVCVWPWKRVINFQFLQFRRTPFFAQFYETVSLPSVTFFHFHSCYWGFPRWPACPCKYFSFQAAFPPTFPLGNVKGIDSMSVPLSFSLYPVPPPLLPFPLLLYSSWDQIAFFLQQWYLVLNVTRGRSRVHTHRNQTRLRIRNLFFSTLIIGGRVLRIWSFYRMLGSYILAISVGTRS